MLVNAARKSDAGPAGAAARSFAGAPRSAKIRVFLVTADDALWPQIGSELDREFALKQVDSVEELHATTSPGDAAIIVWDARGSTDRAVGISDLLRHSPRLALVVIDTAEDAAAWISPLQQRQIAAVLELPIDSARLAAAIASAKEELHARTALLGDSAQAGREPPPTARRWPFVPVLIGLAALLLGAAAFYWYQKSAPPAAVPAKAVAPAQLGAASASNDDVVFGLLEKARQAMLDRHYLDPAEGSALALYRDALTYDPANGEARQGLQRLAQVLFARVQTALDERKYDVALQALETARSISPADPQLVALDARVASIRSEIGPSQIQAAIAAKNFDHAAQLLDEAARAKVLSGAKLAQLREAVRRGRSESDAARALNLVETRLQQNKLLEPRNDSAAFYLQQARAAGASDQDLQAASQELSNRLLQAARAAIEQRQLADVDRWLNEARTDGAPAPAVAALQRDLTAARDSQKKESTAESQLIESARARLAKGAVLEPDKDNALYYFDSLRAANPASPALAPLSQAIQTQIIARAAAALDSGNLASAETLLHLAGDLGRSPDADALANRLAQRKLASGAARSSAANPLVVIKPLKVEYPVSALQDGTEGWVDLAFKVTATGAVSDIKILDASPHGVFEAAAREALSRVRYRPVIKDGAPAEVQSKLRVAFKLTKQ